MEYYHVVIKYVSKLTRKIDIIVDLNRTEEYIKEKIAEPYNKSEEFNFKGRRIDSDYVDSLNILRSKEALEDSKGMFICEAFNEGKSD